MVQRFRTKDRIIAVLLDGEKIAVHIPGGAEIVVIDSLPDSIVDRSQQVKVRWDGRTALMFVVDIRDRCDRIAAATR